MDTQLVFLQYSPDAFASLMVGLITPDTKGICFRPFNPFAAQVLTRLASSYRHISVYAQGVEGMDALPDGVQPLGSETVADIVILCDNNPDTLSARLLDYLDMQQGTLIAPITAHYSLHRPLFMISIPKSGTHLLYELLETLGYKRGMACPAFAEPGIYYFVQGSNSHTPAKEILGRSPYRYPDFMRSPAVFIYRNPLDILISNANYVSRDGRIASAGYYNRLSFEERVIELVDGPWLLEGIRDLVGHYAAWLEMPNVIPISYEEIVGPQGGGDSETQLRLIWSLQLKLHVPGSAQRFAATVYNPNSPTFHKGKVHSYQDSLTPRTREKFLQMPQDFMQIYGYDGPDVAEPVVIPRHAERFRRRGVTVSAIDYDHEQIRVEAGFMAYDIYRYAGLLFAVPQSMGFVDLKHATPEQLAQLPQDRLMGNLKQKIVIELIRAHLQPAKADPPALERPVEALMNQSSNSNYRRIGLKDQRPLSGQEFDRARSICARIEALVAAREEYVQTRGLDQAIALPAANWIESPQNAFCRASRHVTAGTYEIINTLRFYVEFFSGYQLRSFRWAPADGLLDPISPDFDARLPEIAPEPDTWVDRYLAMTRFLPEPMIARPPAMLGEIGWDINGVIVNHDTCVYQERLNLLLEAGIIDFLRRKAQRGDNITILEIGGGYGALACFLKQIVPSANYVICDLPESLLFSSLYLSLTHPEMPTTIYDGSDPSVLRRIESGFCFLPNYLFDDFVQTNQPVDLVINTLSLSEMSEAQVRNYAENCRSLIGDTGVFFEQNQDNRHIGLNYCKEYLADYFAYRTTLEPFTPPGLTEGVPDIWSNRPFAEVISEQAILPPDWQDYRALTVHAYLDVITQQLASRQINTNTAVELLVKVIVNSATPAEVANTMGAALLKEGYAMAGIRLFQRLTELRPEDAYAHNLLGQALFQSQQPRAAQKAFLRAAELAPTSADIQNNLAVIYWQQGDAQHALECIERAKQIDPNNSDVNLNYAAISTALGRTPSAA